MAKTTRIILQGDKIAADKLRLQHGVRVLNEFDRLNSFQNLKQNERRIIFDGGSFVHLTNRFGDRTALFYSPVSGKEIKQPRQEIIPLVVPGFVAFNSSGERIGYLVSTTATFSGPFLAFGPYWECGLGSVAAYYSTGADNYLRHKLIDIFNPAVNDITEVWEVDPGAIKPEFTLSEVRSHGSESIYFGDSYWLGGNDFTDTYTFYIKDSLGNAVCSSLESNQTSTYKYRTWDDGGIYRAHRFYSFDITGGSYYRSIDAWRDTENYSHIYASRLNASENRQDIWFTEGFADPITTEHTRVTTGLSYYGQIILDIDGEETVLYAGDNSLSEKVWCRYYKTPFTDNSESIGFFVKGAGDNLNISDTEDFVNLILFPNFMWAEEVTNESVVYFTSNGQTEFPYPEEQFTKMEGYTIDGQDVYIDLLFTGGSEYPAIESTFGLFYLDKGQLITSY